MNDNPLRQLPAVHLVFDHPTLITARADHARKVVLNAIRQELDASRELIKTGAAELEFGLEELAHRVISRIAAATARRIRTVINATGIVLHTNLGRSPLAEEAAEAAYQAARGYLDLEFNLQTGKRSSRQRPIRELLMHLTGAESATVVNNGAAATIIALRALAAGREVIVSRGQLIEIGGSFRIPEIMAVSGATLREVGTTNITRIDDYENAIGPNTGAMMRVHTSNYRIRGFTGAASLQELVALGRRRCLPVIDDIGSGALVDFAPFGVPDEPVISQSIAAGCELVLCSGDKLLGGPQAGLILGKRELIERIEKDPIMRALRIDKMTLAALEATLRLYLNRDRVLSAVPTLRMLALTRDEIRQRAETLANLWRSLALAANIEVMDDEAYAGGGSLPTQPLPTAVIAITPEAMSEADFASRLRLGDPAVVARIQAGKVLFDLRTVFEAQEAGLVQAVTVALSS